MRLPTRIAVAGALLVAVVVAQAADLDHLRDSARWLREERLRGTLFHDPNIQPLRPMLLAPADPGGRTGAPTPISLRGWHHIVILPDDEGVIAFRLRDLRAEAHFSGSAYALFDQSGRQVAEGVVPAGEELPVRVAAATTGPHILMLNPGPASSSACELTVLNPHWAIDSAPRARYMRGPLRYHFLRDHKLGGFNLAMIDLEGLAQEFVTDEGLAAWTNLARQWTDYARNCQLRIMPSVNLGGTSYEVEAWGDAPKGLYPEHDPNKPLAPCPLQKVYWERIFLRRGREIARLSLDNPWIVGYGLDPEMYQCWLYGHYMLSGTCFCDHCLGGFLQRQGLGREALALTTGKERLQWLQERGLMNQYYRYLADEMTAIAAWCREQLHAINPHLLLNMFVIEIGNWFCEGIARGFGLPDLPVVNFCEHTYYSVGYDRKWLDQTHERYRQWQANVLQGSALWDLHFPPTRPSFLAAHAFNLAVNDEGWWFWPGDDLYRDWGARYAYLDQPAYFEQYWDACVWANREIEATMATPGYQSPLAAFEVVPWRGQIRGSELKTEPQVVRQQTEPSLPLRLAGPATLSFAVPERAESFEVIAQARGVNNGGVVTVRDPAGALAASAQGELDAPQRLAVTAARPGVWTVEVSADAALPLRDFGLRVDQLPTMFSPEPRSLLVPPAKRPGLIGWWPMDEGSGRTVADRSPSPPYDGTLQGATWTAGRVGNCLQFDGHSGRVSIPVEYSFHSLRRFTLAAWVKLTGLPQQGNGHTIVNKGPEAPVQHFWWWIGYPPNYSLILELGSEAHQWGAGFGSQPLQWELGRWYHVAVVFECDGQKSTVTHYRDGEVVGTQTRDEVFHSGTYDLRIGDYGGLHWMDGCIDEVKIWDRALSAEEIRAEFAAVDR